jgi:hypothetical protein
VLIQVVPDAICHHWNAHELVTKRGERKERGGGEGGREGVWEKRGGTSPSRIG